MILQGRTKTWPHSLESDSYQRPITAIPLGKESVKEVGQIEHGRNMKTDALNHLSWFLPTARQCCRAVCATSSMKPARAEGDGVTKSPACHQPQVPWGKERARGAVTLHLTVPGRNHVPPLPIVPSSKGWILPPPGRPAVNACSLLHWDRLAPEQPLRQAPASRRPRQTCKSSCSPPHIYGASLDFILMGENPGGVTGLT